MLDAFELALDVIKDKSRRIRKLERALAKIDGIAVDHVLISSSEYADMLSEISQITGSVALDGRHTPRQIRKNKVAKLGR